MDQSSYRFYDEAEVFVRQTNRASISSLQRKFRIGYNQAARLMEELQNNQVVSEPETNGARSVLKPPFQYDLSVFIGRFQPFHAGHLSVVKQALELAPKVIILLGSADKYRTYNNPWTATEREIMIRQCFSDSANNRLKCLPLNDTGDNETWVKLVKSLVSSAEIERTEILLDQSVSLIGHNKDASSFYLSLFPEWKMVEADNHGAISATHIREKLLNGSWVEELDNLVKTNVLTQPVADYLLEQLKTDEFSDWMKKIR